jgi:hypothetical protein
MGLKDKVAREICSAFAMGEAVCRPLCQDCRDAATKIGALISDDLRKRYGGASQSADHLDSLMGVE